MSEFHRRISIGRNLRLRSRRFVNAFTLIELLLVLALVSALLGATIGLTSVSSQDNHRAEQNLMQRQEIRRFSSTLRDDMRAADRRTIGETELTLSNSLQDTQITYNIESQGRISRRMSNAVEEADSQDQFEMGDATTIQLQPVEGFDAVRWTISTTNRAVDSIEVIASQESD